MVRAKLFRVGVTKPSRARSYNYLGNMKCRKWLVLFLLAFASPTFAQRVQSASKSCSWTKSCTAPFSNTVSAGDSIAVAVKVSSWGTGAQVPTLTDAQHNSYTLVSSANASSALYQTFVFYTPNAVGGANSIMSVLPTANVQDMVALEFRGSSTVVQRTMATGTSTLAVSPTISFQSGDFLFGVATSKYSDVFKPGTGFTTDTSLGDIAVAYSSPSAAGSAGVSFSLLGSTTWTALLVGFRPGTQSTSPTPTPTPLTVSIASPSSGATVSGTIKSSGTAVDGTTISSVQVSVDNGSYSNATGTNNWNANLDTTSLSNATHTLTARATDSSGKTATSNPVSFTVNNAAAPTSGPTATVNWTDVHQQIEGFGASSAFTGDGITNNQADLFWSTTNGVGLSLLRVQIQPNGTYPDLATMQKARDRGVRIWGSPWSPPASMKSNGSLNNGGSLLASSYQAYADYLAKYVLTLKNPYGIDLYALSIQNEPNYTATWASCIWTGQQFHDFLLNNLLPTFAKNGVDVKIIMPEEAGWNFDLASATLNDPGTAAGVDIIAAHNYDGGGASAYSLGQNQGKELWETEVSTFDSFNPGIANGLFWAQKIQDWMTVASANAWHYWWLIDSGGDNQALTDDSGNPAKRLYVLGNFSKFVRPGYYRIGATASPVSGVSISAYKDPSTGKFAIVAINHNASAVTLNFALNGFTAGSVTPWVTSSGLNLAQQPSISVGGSAFPATLPASSVTTLVGP